MILLPKSFSTKFIWSKVRVAMRVRQYMNFISVSFSNMSWLRKIVLMLTCTLWWFEWETPHEGSSILILSSQMALWERWYSIAWGTPSWGRLWEFITLPPFLFAASALCSPLKMWSLGFLIQLSCLLFPAVPPLPMPCELYPSGTISQKRLFHMLLWVRYFIKTIQSN